MKSIPFTKDSLLGEGFWFADGGSGGGVEQLLPVLRWVLDITPIAYRSDLWTVGRAAACLGILATARILGRGLARRRRCVGGVGTGCRHGRKNGAVA